MYEELIKELRSATGWKNASAHYSLMNRAADAIGELNKLRWIPVDEYGVLPDHYETVLLYIESEPEGYITIGSYDYIEMRWKDFCDVNREVYQADVVTHWMHLPQPPKEET